VNLAIFPIDEEGKKIDGIFKLMEASSVGTPLVIKENIIMDVDVSNGILNIYFKSNLKTTLSLGVNVYEIN